MTDIYYQLEDSNGNKLTYISDDYNENHTRSIWDQDIPFVRDKWIQDQISTAIEISITGIIKVGTARPYSTVKLAFAALRAMTSSSRSTGGTLKGGDWNGTTWTYNSSYPELGDGSTKILAATINFSHGARGVGFGQGGEIPIKITLKIGQVY